ncbi:hypothetical protein, partial [uncultured Hymenobacter sp.]|uniref:hypothetical protein n=1 Tax=uncultured Hymenobacter sp. TaxID=170016 RepID=UPI0035C944EB
MQTQRQHSFFSCGIVAGNVARYIVSTAYVKATDTTRCSTNKRKEKQKLCSNQAPVPARCRGLVLKEGTPLVFRFPLSIIGVALHLRT